MKFYNYFRLSLFIAVFISLPFVLINCSDEESAHSDQTAENSDPYSDGPLDTLRDESLAPFYHGLASGDPLTDRVILWTRVTPKNKGSVKVNWMIATDREFKQVINHGSLSTDASRDYTVKIDADKLKPGTTYYYKFEAFGKESMVGTTRTLPENAEEVRLAFASCSNYEFGYFNAYRAMANDTLDAIVHLGDYIYEYAPGYYGDMSLGRINIPDHEIVSLMDYRQRYSLYRLDKDLQAAHAAHPFITIWDDHEMANNSYVEGAQNHQPDTEGDWENRKQNARRAYYEWLPVRESDHLYRTFSFGDLLTLSMLDTRIAGRTVQTGNITDSIYMDSSRSMLGQVQLQWLMDNLKQSTVWKIIGNQVPFGTLNTGFEGEAGKYMDGWDGYPVERGRLLDFIRDNAIQNVIIATGDYHSSFALENDHTGTADVKDNLAVEFVAPSVTSANIDEYVSRDSANLHGMQYMQHNPHMRYANMCDHGYVRVSVTRERAVAEMRYVKDIRQPGKTDTDKVRFVVMAGKPVIERK